MITFIRNALKARGYVVHASRQEKVNYEDLVVLLDDVDTRLADSATYYSTVWITIEWDTISLDNIPTKIVTLISGLEEDVADSTEECKATFKFIQSEVNQLGIACRVIVTVEYVDTVGL